jgi:hypothetical protein
MGLPFTELASFKCVAKIEEFLIVTKEKIQNPGLFSCPDSLASNFVGIRHEKGTE